MKKILSLAMFIAVTLTSYSQSLEFKDLGILFSQDDQNGSARFRAMGGAFGALGGDLSVMNINPAGIAVFNNSSFSGTFNSRDTETATFYGDASFNDRRSLNFSNNFFNLSHAGAVLVFDSAYSNSDWSKFALGFNYRITKDFSDSFATEGNAAITTFETNPNDTNDPQTIFNFTDGQAFETTLNGDLTEINFAFSSVYQNKIYVGLGLNFYDLNFSQQSLLTELNSSQDNRLLDVELSQENFITGTGFSANLGFIYKLSKQFRFGASYQTPTWFNEVIQETNFIPNDDTNFGEVTYFPEEENAFTESNNFQLLNYRLRTPSKLTGSAAFIFGKNGLLSLDYIIRNYNNLNFSGNFFAQDNQFFQNRLKTTHSYNIGTEWRLQKFSVRGGYSFEESPFIDTPLTSTNVLNFNDVEGYSFGAGYNFGSFKLDFAYSDNNRESTYNLYNGIDVGNAQPRANIITDNRIVTATITINL
ncbi:hemin receptor [Polaribacter sp. WD7]|uniref:OmpP1/FadL family transporter n=1 Tax=Polaribacter sp. WD7 TaxID=2269061 RepID=UPI000DF42236|nr:outer membrane protein transport protein [Polaribacter sp. WD7]RCS27910.1 hemin receptor [Polaribacter sp. WD7]